MNRHVRLVGALRHPLAVGLLAVVSAVFAVAAEAAPLQAGTAASASPAGTVAGLSARPDAAAAATGLVLADQTALRAAPREGAPLLVPLWRGEALQLRGARGDWLQVWDPHRERGGYVRAAQVLPVPAGDAAVPDLAAQLRLLRQQPGAEALGLGVAAALAERAAGGWLTSAAGAEMLDTMVLLQERLALRAQTAGPAQQAAAVAHTDVAARYGFALHTVPRADGSQQWCPNPVPATLLRGHAAATAAQQARAALSLTRADCIPADTLPSRRLELLEQQAAWLDGIDAAALVPVERNRWLLRSASVLASLAYARRTGDAPGAATAAYAAWSRLIPAELSDDDAPAVREAAVRLSPLRWLLQPAAPSRQLGRFDLRLQPGGAGETCLSWTTPAGGVAQQRCSHGRIHLPSARLSPDGRAVALNVQPLDGWTELWRLDADGTVQVLPPSGEVPGLGAVEFAGWVAAKDGAKDGAQVLVAREAEAGGRALRRFELYGADWTKPLRWAGEPGLLGAFQRSADASWRSATTIAR